jgi:hypothetical protein
MIVRGVSDWGAWPAPGNRVNRAPGISGGVPGVWPDRTSIAPCDDDRAVDLIQARRHVDENPVDPPF